MDVYCLKTLYGDFKKLKRANLVVPSPITHSWGVRNAQDHSLTQTWTRVLLAQQLYISRSHANIQNNTGDAHTGHSEAGNRKECPTPSRASKRKRVRTAQHHANGPRGSQAVAWDHVHSSTQYRTAKLNNVARALQRHSACGPPNR